MIVTTTAAVATSINVFNWGNNIYFQSFSLNRLFQTVIASINNCSISINSQNVIPGIVQMLLTEKLQQYQYGTPTLFDNYANYIDMVGTISPVSGVPNMADVLNSPFLNYYRTNFDNKTYLREYHLVQVGSSVGGLANSSYILFPNVNHVFT